MIRFTQTCWTRNRFLLGAFLVMFLVGMAHDTPAPANPRSASRLLSHRPKADQPWVKPAPPLLSSVHPLILASFQVLVSLTALVAFSIKEEEKEA